MVDGVAAKNNDRGRAQKDRRGPEAPEGPEGPEINSLEGLVNYAIACANAQDYEEARQAIADARCALLSGRNR